MQMMNFKDIYLLMFFLVEFFLTLQLTMDRFIFQ